jgi:hypothetical protein
MVDCLGLGDILRPPSDDERDLGLVVDLLARRRELDRRPVGPERVAELGEKVGLAGGSVRPSLACSA